MCARYFDSTLSTEGVQLQTDKPLLNMISLANPVAKKCCVLGCIHNPTNHKVWSTKARHAKKSGCSLRTHKTKFLLQYGLWWKKWWKWFWSIFSGWELGILLDKLRKSSFFACLCCRGQTGISCYQGESPACLNNPEFILGFCISVVEQDGWTGHLSRWKAEPGKLGPDEIDAWFLLTWGCRRTVSLGCLRRGVGENLQSVFLSFHTW